MLFNPIFWMIFRDKYFMYPVCPKGVVVAGSRTVWSITTGRVCRNTLASARGSPSGHCKIVPYPSCFVAVPPTLDIGLLRTTRWTRHGCISFSMLDDGIIKSLIFNQSDNSNEVWIPIFMKFLQFHLARSSAWLLQELKELFLRGIRQTASLNTTSEKSPGLTEENDMTLFGRNK